MISTAQYLRLLLRRQLTLLDLWCWARHVNVYAVVKDGWMFIRSSSPDIVWRSSALIQKMFFSLEQVGLALPSKEPTSIGFQGHQSGILFGASVVDACIPFLASRPLMDRLGCIIDFDKRTLYIKLLGVTIPLKLKHGHLAVSIADSHQHVRFSRCWHELSYQQLWVEPGPELVIAPQAIVSSAQQQGNHELRCSSTIDQHSGMAQFGDQTAYSAFEDAHDDGQDGEIGFPEQAMADCIGESAGRRRRSSRPVQCLRVQHAFTQGSRGTAMHTEASHSAVVAK